MNLNQLVALYNARRYAELESRAHALIGRYPDSGFAWKLLGAVPADAGQECAVGLSEDSGTDAR